MLREKWTESPSFIAIGKLKTVEDKTASLGEKTKPEILETKPKKIKIGNTIKGENRMGKYEYVISALPAKTAFELRVKT